MSRARYHHGDLRTALIEAAEEIICETGMEGFTLRKAAGRAGVSPGAPSHHFGDMKGLLTAVAIRVFDRLGEALDILPQTDHPASDLRCLAKGYVRFAAEHPGFFRLICRVDLIDCRDPVFLEASYTALSPLTRAIAVYYGHQMPERFDRNGQSEDGPLLRPNHVSAMATVHGLAHMVLEGRPALVFETEDPVRTFMETALPDILAASWPDREAVSR